jgi:molybdopterin-guanine dinucleotide biosynthesis protein A
MSGSHGDFTGIVLAGGASSRMGRDKTALMLSGLTLLRRAIDTVRRAGGRAMVIGPPRPAEALGFAAQIDDASLGPPAGPLRALCCGLEAAGGTAIVLACDVPLVPPGFLRALFEALPQWDAVVPECGGTRHVLAAAYGPKALAAGLDARSRGESSVRAILPSFRVNFFDEGDLRPWGGPGILLNVNTPDDLEAAAARLGAVEGRTGQEEGP